MAPEPAQGTLERLLEPLGVRSEIDSIERHELIRREHTVGKAPIPQSKKKFTPVGL